MSNINRFATGIAFKGISLSVSYSDALFSGCRPLLPSFNISFFVSATMFALSAA